MTNVSITGSDDYTHPARLAVLAAARTQHDFAGWLASVLGRGGGGAWILGRAHRQPSRSWEAELVQQLTKGTVGWDDEVLADYREPLS